VSTANSPLAQRRRSAELHLGVIGAVVTAGGYLLTALAKNASIPPELWVLVVAILGLFLVAHLGVRKLAPRADSTILPIALLMNGIGWFVIARLQSGGAGGELARVQAIWTAIGVAAFVLTLAIVRRVRMLERYRYTFLLIGVIALVLPLAPGIGRKVRGAQLWVGIGPVSLQPGEFSKVLLVIFFAAYLADRGPLLARRPTVKVLGPLVLAFAFPILIMVIQQDLGSSLLLFSVFAAMLYIGSGRAWYLAAGFSAFGAATTLSYELFSRVRDRTSAYINPWADPKGKGYQLLQSLFSFGSGGLTGTGLGLGNPTIVPAITTDFIFAAIGEELGFVGTLAVIIGYLLLIGSGFRIALAATKSFDKLFAAGLTTVIAVQVFVIVGGVTRVIPLTGITLPFISYGGSSLIANYILIALLLRVSDETGEQAERAAASQARATSVASAR
jgi:cell division protein FtsW (lipid II flippase)